MDGVEGKSVLVTGGCGSIGSNITRTVLERRPATVRVLDNNEQQIFDFKSRLEYDDVEFVLGNVRDRDELTEAFEDIDLVVHTAALKHVGLVERNPFQAAETNIYGTKNVIRASLEQGVGRVIMLSTDKATNPASAMGASKLMAERIAIASNRYDIGASCVRLGNVLGTRGSVVPVFMNQIRRGGPLTVTDPDMTRFVILPTEAASFIVDSLSAMDGGEIFLPKMVAFRVGDLAEAMRDRYAPEFGYDPAEVEISMMGAQQGERYHEKLISRDELRYTDERDDRFVINFDPEPGSGGEDRFENSLSDEYTSEDAELLSKEAIVSMIEDTRRVHDGSSPMASNHE